MRNNQLSEKQPTTLLEAVRYYSDINRCVRILAEIRWSNGVTCPVCASKEITTFKSRQIWKCRTCKKQFSVKKGTAFEQSPLGLDKWFVCLWLIANAKNGISSCEIARSIGITQKSAWFMLHRCREVLRNGSFEKLSGTVEADEAYFGGSDTNRHEWKKLGKDAKATVFGAVQRGGKIIAKVIETADTETLHFAVRDSVVKDSTLYTDEANGYATAKFDFIHDTVNHSAKEYVRKEEDGTKVHTNTIEGYWSLVKRTISGTYVSVEPFHLERYLDEYGFRYDNRKTNDGTRFLLALANVTGRRLTHKQLLANG
jgi:transposase-like protein